MISAKMFAAFVFILLGVLHSGKGNPTCNPNTSRDSDCRITNDASVSTPLPVSEIQTLEDSTFVENLWTSESDDPRTIESSSAKLGIKQHSVGGVVQDGTAEGFISSQTDEHSKIRKRRHLPEGCEEFVEDKSNVVTVKRVDVAFGAVGIIPDKKDPITIGAVVEFAGDSPDVTGVGLWKLSMYGSTNADGSGEQFQRQDQLLSNLQQAKSLENGEFINFGLLTSEIDMTKIGCDKDFRYLCFDFAKGEHAMPDFQFESSQPAIGGVQLPDSKWTNCSNLCQQIPGTAVLRAFSFNSEIEVDQGTQGPALQGDFNLVFSQASDDITGNGLWKLSIYGSNSDNGRGEKHQLTEQLLTDAHQAIPLVSGRNITFRDVQANFDYSTIGCGQEFRYVCFEFTKGDQPSVNFDFIAKLGTGANVAISCSDRCPPVEEGTAVIEFFRVNLRAKNLTQGHEVTINATGVFTGASAEIAGTGLWKLSMYGSTTDRDGNGRHFERTDQLLSTDQQAQPLTNTKEVAFYGVKGHIDMSAIGCDREARFLCFDLTKGDIPNPDYDFVSFQDDNTKHTVCVDGCERQTGTAVIVSLRVQWTANGVKANQKDPFTMNATIGFSEATDYLSGSGLWKLSMYGSPNEDGTGDQFQRVDQMLTSQHQAQALTESNREEMIFYNVEGELDILAIGCGKKYRYVCFDFSRGDNPKPSFIFKSHQEDTTKMTLCSDRCKQAVDLNIENGFILVTDLAGAIRAAPLDLDSGFISFRDLPVQNLHAPVAIDFDPVHQKIYFTDVVSDTINRCNLDGSAREVLLDLADGATPDGLSLAIGPRIMYWTDATLQTIEKADLDGNNREIILRSPKPRAIVVDPNHEWFYWTDWGNQAKIEKAHVDGTNRVTLIDTGLQWPNGLTIDFTAGRMYWCDAGTNKIESSDLNGGDRKTHFSTGTQLDIHPYDIGVYRGTLYWSDWAFNNLLKLGTTLGSQPALVGGSGQAVFRRGGGIHIQPGTSRSRRDASFGLSR